MKLKDFPCTICHDYGSTECDCVQDPYAEIARLQAEMERLTALVGALTERVDLARDGANTAHNAAIEAAANEVNTLEGCDRTIKWAVALIRTLKRPVS